MGFLGAQFFSCSSNRFALNNIQQLNSHNLVTGGGVSSSNSKYLMLSSILNKIICQHVHFDTAVRVLKKKIYTARCSAFDVHRGPSNVNERMRCLSVRSMPGKHRMVVTLSNFLSAIFRRTKSAATL